MFKENYVKEAKIQGITGFLTKHFQNSEIQYQHEFSTGSEVFKISLTKGFLLLKVGEEFLEDNDESEIIKLMGKWSVISLLEENGKLGVLLTTDGPRKIV